jgi:hypothetical protein
MRWSVLNAKTMPSGLPRANFSVNHDNVQLLTRACGAQCQVLSFIQIFKPGIPFVFSEELRGREEFFQKLLLARRDLSGFAAEYCLGDQMNENLHVVLWRCDDQQTVAAFANLSAHFVDTTVPVCSTSACIRVGSQDISVESSNNSTRVRIAPWGFALIELKN